MPKPKGPGATPGGTGKPKSRQIDPRQARLLLEEPPLSEALAYFEATYIRTAKPGTAKTYRSVLRFWTRELDAIAVADGRDVGFPVPSDVDRISAAQIGRHTETHGQEGVSRNVMRMRKRVLSTALDHARSKWRLLPNFVQQSARIAAEPLKPRGLADPLATFPLLLAVMPDARARVFLRLQREYGLRIGEVLGLEIGHVNFARSEVAILQQRDADHCAPAALKTDTSSATIPVDPELLTELRLALREDMRASHRQTQARRRFLFPYYRRDLEALVDLCRQVAPSDFPAGDAWHVLRHTFGTEAVEAFGMHVERVRGLMRHANVRTTQTYIGSIRGGYYDAGAMRELIAMRQARNNLGAAVPALPGVSVAAVATVQSSGPSGSATRGTSMRAGSTVTTSPATEGGVK